MCNAFMKMKLRHACSTSEWSRWRLEISFIDLYQLVWNIIYVNNKLFEFELSEVIGYFQLVSKKKVYNVSYIFPYTLPFCNILCIGLDSMFSNYFCDFLTELIKL